jgi:hypothetical protein
VQADRGDQEGRKKQAERSREKRHHLFEQLDVVGICRNAWPAQAVGGSDDQTDERGSGREQSRAEDKGQAVRRDPGQASTGRWQREERRVVIEALVVSGSGRGRGAGSLLGHSHESSPTWRHRRNKNERIPPPHQRPLRGATLGCNRVRAGSSRSWLRANATSASSRRLGIIRVVVFGVRLAME